MNSWETKELQELAAVERGKFSARPRNDPRYYGGTFPFVQTGDVASAKGRLRNYSQTLNEEGLKVSRLFPKGTILVTIAANIGDAAIADFDVACPDSLVAISPKKGIDPTWLIHSIMIRKPELESYATQNAQKNINLQVLRPLAIDVPPTGEQEGIGRILSEWDRAIDLIEHLIAAKQECRTWLMQQLLTGKRRLPGFGKAWRTVHLGDVFTNRIETGCADLPLIAITGENGVVSRDDVGRKDTSSEDKSRYLRIAPGDIGYNTMRMWQGVCGLSTMEGIVSPAYTIVTPKKSVDGEFMALLFKSPVVIHLFHRHSQGLVDDTLNLKWKHFAQIKLSVPEKSEQMAIAKTFHVFDHELNLLRAQLDALREQKKGLMQQLLTGEKRIKSWEGYVNE